MDEIPDFALIRYVIFVDISETLFMIRPINDVGMSHEYLHVAIDQGRARVVHPPLETVASAMTQVLQQFPPSIPYLLMRILARMEIRGFFGGLTDTTQVTGVVTAVAEHAAIIRCMTTGIDSLRHLWNEAFVDSCILAWYRRYRSIIDVRVQQVGFLQVLHETIQQIHSYIDTHFVALEQ